MSLFFSGAVTSSPVRRGRSSGPCPSLDSSLLSPDSSYLCHSWGSGGGGGAPCCCRRSPRLLTNGYYDVTEESFCRDHEGNVSLTPCKTNVSYKENLVRVFRRRRKPRHPLARLLSDVTESCQTWLDEKIFRGVFGTSVDQDQDQDQDQDRLWAAPPLDQSWSCGGGAELDFRYDPTEAPPPPDKEPPPTEGVASDQSFRPSEGGLSEVPPPPVRCLDPASCRSSPEVRGLTEKKLLLLLFIVFITAALVSRCVWWSSGATCSVLVVMTSFMVVKRSGPLGRWRRTRTEDITSRNE